MIVAQGYQESGLDQTQRSRAGAVGIMQVLPTTAADPNVGIKDIHQINNNIHAGVKYLRFLRSRYFDAAEISPLDRVLFSFAAYNAGPGNIRKARRKAKAMGFDPNQWFDHVEVAAARSISREPVIYVRNILKYFISYKLLEEIRLKKKVSK
jgi:membrane-bound lytic murein transglycosylase MltF